VCLLLCEKKTSGGHKWIFNFRKKLKSKSIFFQLSNKNKNAILMRNLILRIIIGIFFCGHSIVVSAQNGNTSEINKNIDIYMQLLNKLNLNYVDTINPTKLVRTSINAMLKTLDPYTIFISEDEANDFKTFTKGTYGGIGIGIHEKDSSHIVGSIKEGCPAHRAGMRCGDIFIEIDGVNVQNKKISELCTLIKGKVGTSLTIKVRRYNEKDLISLNLKREIIQSANVPYYTILDKNIGYINLTHFLPNAASDVENAYDELNTAHKLKGLIIDLRNNGGGLMSEAVDIVGMFVKRKQKVASIYGRIENQNTTFRTNLAPVNLNIPLVILINKNTASAAEVVSGSFQDLDRAVLIGQRSFGKGLVQHIFPLYDNNQVKITAAKYYIPSGRCIQKINYSSKDENGKFAKTPDSLITAYRTRNGRKVYDGGGIEPDIKTKPLTLSKITESLFRKMIIFDFAVDYYSKNKKKPNLKTFKVSNKLYRSFLKFIADKDYDYTTKSEEALKVLKENTIKEKYFDAIKKQFNALKKSMGHNKDADLKKYKEEIKNLIRIEILDKYYYEKGRISALIKTNLDIKKAIELLKDKKQYDAILNP
jgi:carboxyl-terminal processing protease